MIKYITGSMYDKFGVSILSRSSCRNKTRPRRGPKGDKGVTQFKLLFRKDQQWHRLSCTSKLPSSPNAAIDVTMCDKSWVKYLDACCTLKGLKNKRLKKVCNWTCIVLSLCTS